MPFAECNSSADFQMVTNEIVEGMKATESQIDKVVYIDLYG